MNESSGKHHAMCYSASVVMKFIKNSSVFLSLQRIVRQKCRLSGWPISCSKSDSKSKWTAESPINYMNKMITPITHMLKDIS